MRTFNSDLTKESVNVWLKTDQVEDLIAISTHYKTSVSSILIEILEKVDLPSRVERLNDERT